MLEISDLTKRTGRLLELADAMIDKLDKITVLRQIEELMNKKIPEADLVRSEVNMETGFCSTNAYIVTQSGRMDNLTDQLVAAMNAVEQKIEASKS